MLSSPSKLNQGAQEGDRRDAAGAVRGISNPWGTRCSHPQARGGGVCVCVCHLCIHTYMHTYVYIHTCTHTQTHTHTHTHTQAEAEREFERFRQAKVEQQLKDVEV